MQIMVSTGTVGASYKIGEMLPLCDCFWLPCSVLTFFPRSCAQVEPLDRFSRFRLWLKRRVSVQG